MLRAVQITEKSISLITESFDITESTLVAIIDASFRTNTKSYFIVAPNKYQIFMINGEWFFNRTYTFTDTELEDQFVEVVRN